ncbi:MAG: endo-1,4-beta-xylanase [Phycisphaerales bacterium]|nr:endo-1,4-beta-xylanase [Phycisphaerales bacterium]
MHDSDALCSATMPDAAYLVGADDIALPSTITFDDGVVECDKRSCDAAALVVGYDAGSAGQLTLQTCQLPERDEPYILALELARSRIRLFLAKLEDWMLYDLDKTHPAMVQFDEARDLFVRALTLGSGEQAEALARESLDVCIQAGEALALHHAELLLSRRLKSPLAPRTTLGCMVHPVQWSERLRSVVASHFDYLCMPIRWRDLEPEEGEYGWRLTDRWIEWAVRTARKPVMAGPILDFSKLAVPDWLYIWEHDYETLRELVTEHIRAVVTRYRRVIQVWNVASGINVNGNFSLTYEQMMDLTRVCLMLVKKLQPTARVMLDVTQPFAEHHATQVQSLPPMMYLEMVLEAGMPVDSFGVHLQVGQPVPGRSTRDLLRLSHVLDRFARLDHPVVVTACGAPSEMIEPGEAAPGEAGPTGCAGYWRAPWSETIQTDWLTKVMTLALSKPYVESVCWQELYDHPTSEMPAGGLISSVGIMKPALRRVGQIRACLQSGRLPSEAETVVLEEEEAQA